MSPLYFTDWENTGSVLPETKSIKAVNLSNDLAFIIYMFYNGLLPGKAYSEGDGEAPGLIVGPDVRYGAILWEMVAKGWLDEEV